MVGWDLTTEKSPIKGLPRRPKEKPRQVKLLKVGLEHRPIMREPRPFNCRCFLEAFEYYISCWRELSLAFRRAKDIQRPLWKTERTCQGTRRCLGVELEAYDVSVHLYTMCRYQNGWFIVHSSKDPKQGPSPSKQGSNKQVFKIHKDSLSFGQCQSHETNQPKITE